MSKLNKEIASIMRLFPLEYPSVKYNSAQKRFSIILNELLKKNIVCTINTSSTIKNDSKVRYYDVCIDYQNVGKKYKSRQAAKNRIFKEYLKHYEDAW